MRLRVEEVVGDLHRTLDLANFTLLRLLLLKICVSHRLD